MRTSQESEEKNWCLWARRTIADIDTGKPYLERLTIVQTPWFSVKLHRILMTDGGRDLHDHPWPFVSFVLDGWYEEEVPRCRECARLGYPVCALDAVADLECQECRVSIRRIRFANWKRATDFHRISAISENPPITLVITGPRVRDWGFLTPFGWVNWKNWVSDRLAGRRPRPHERF